MSDLKPATMVIPLDVIKQFQSNEISEARIHMLLHQILEGTSPGLFAYTVLKPIIELSRLISQNNETVSNELEHSIQQFMEDFNITYTYED